MNDGQHCRHWYDDDGPCCRCGYNGAEETACPGRRARVYVVDSIADVAAVTAAELAVGTEITAMFGDCLRLPLP
jgi:hypothetical protein